MSERKTSIKSMDAGNSNIPDGLRGPEVVTDSLLNSVGIYSKSDIDYAKFNSFSRFGRVLDPYGKVNPCREYLFFVKPDLHIAVPAGDSLDDSNSIYYPMIQSISRKKDRDNWSKNLYTNNGLRLNPQLENYPYFKDLIDSHPQVVNQLQYSATKDSPFANLLSFYVNSYLPLDSSDAKTMDNPTTIFGTSYNYLQDSEKSDESYDFNLEFIDNKNLDVYHFFKAYSEYHIARKSGLVTPPTEKYWQYKRLHNTMGIYKFIVAEDMETIIYWAYLWGVFPKSCPREAFQNPDFRDGLTFGVSFEASFIEDMSPMILYQFNELMADLVRKTGRSKDDWLPVVKQNRRMNFTNEGNARGYSSDLNDLRMPTSMIEGKLPTAALVDKVQSVNGTPKYCLRWYAK